MADVQPQTGRTAGRPGSLPAAAAGTIRIGGEVEVNRMGFGAMRITGEGIWGEPRDHDEAIRVLLRAVDLGVNFIDTADSYGPDVSERLIAEALHPYPPDLLIATKGGLLRAGPNRWTPDGRPSHLREVLQGSLRRLKVDRIDLYQLHHPDPRVPFEESLGALVEEQKAGRIRFIGLSNVSVRQLEQARRLTQIVSVQNRFNYDDQASNGVLEACEEAELAFLPWAPLQTTNASLERVAREHEVSPRQIALAWLLHRSSMMLPIPGTSTVRHLEENIAATGLRLTQEDLEELEGLH